MLGTRAMRTRRGAAKTSWSLVDVASEAVAAAQAPQPARTSAVAVAVAVAVETSLAVARMVVGADEVTYGYYECYKLST